ncbi:MAG: glycoside hydrolase family 2 protein [Dethiobacteria bacterium]
MITLDLNGPWILMRSDDPDNPIEARIPGCNYLDLMREKIIDDVFYGTNERLYRWVAEKDWIYTRQFTVDDRVLDHDFIFLSVSGLDTVADIYINEELIGHGKNAYVDYRFDLKNHLLAGGNEIKIYFHSPIKYISEKQRKDPFPHNYNGLTGFPHLRKPAYHFGWDWGPILPPSGISGGICINAFKRGYINDFAVRQQHFKDKVRLVMALETVRSDNAESRDFALLCKIFGPDDQEICTQRINLTGDKMNWEMDIDHPVLWYPNGYRDVKTQPLYRIELELIDQEEIHDKKHYKIGLRTIELDRDNDRWGQTFAFKVNGKKIFCKGANWIPADSFITRTDADHLEYLVRSMAQANMNMVRVWGGGYYGSEEFFDLCDKYGLLVWQDFQFACAPYPLYDHDFLNDVLREIDDQVKRLRHRASLALWCGNNEIEMMSPAWMTRRKFIRSAGDFFYKILPRRVKRLDPVTPYWYGSPSGGRYLKGVNADATGDTHLWNVWHGLQSFSYYRRRLTRFCSEFGFQSLPDIDTVRTFATEKDLHMTSEVMNVHQKCISGNDKIIYYMVSHFFIPSDFEDLIYISQLIQAESIKYAVEHFRRNNGRCNGALYWQLNDCWPVNSWSSIDYYGKWKALHYYAKRFNQPVAVSFLPERRRIKIYAYNEKQDDFKGVLRWKIVGFDGQLWEDGMETLVLKFNEVYIRTLDAARYLKPDSIGNTVLFAGIYDQYDRQIAYNTFLFTKERYLQLTKPKITRQLRLEDGVLIITLKSNTFAKGVMLHLKGIRNPFSDNFFDLLKDEERSITIKVGHNCNLDDLRARLSVKCLNDAERKYAKFRERLIRLKILLLPMNIANKILYKFL